MAVIQILSEYDRTLICCYREEKKDKWIIICFFKTIYTKSIYNESSTVGIQIQDIWLLKSSE